MRTFDGGLSQVLKVLSEERLTLRAETAQVKEKERQKAERDRPPEAPPVAVPGQAQKIRNPILFAKLEQKIMVLETEAGAIQQKMTDPEYYSSREKMQALLARKAELERELAEAYSKWENWQ